jgi:hypothetical protein
MVLFSIEEALILVSISQVIAQVIVIRTRTRVVIYEAPFCAHEGLFRTAGSQNARSEEHIAIDIQVKGGDTL